jgi:2-methylisocitrate lyase-like PEP mutase family enzyme
MESAPRSVKRTVDPLELEQRMSAKVIRGLGFQAIYVTSTNVTNMWFAMPDQGFMGLHEIVDAETGFGNALNVCHAVRTLGSEGVDCIQLEDRVAPKRCGHFPGKEVISIEEAVSKIKAAIDARHEPDLFFMARTDAVHGFEAAVERVQKFSEAGANILFVETVTKAEKIRARPQRLAKP